MVLRDIEPVRKTCFFFRLLFHLLNSVQPIENNGSKTMYSTGA